MKNVLRYYYNLSVDELNEFAEYAIIRQEDDLFIFKKFMGDEEELKIITEELIKNNIPIHQIIINTLGNILTDYNAQKYILMHLNDIKTDIDLNFFQIYVPETNIDVAKLWSNKIDYCSRQVYELGLGKELLVNTFNYYVGMAENAVSIYNRAMKSNENLIYAITHRRINYPNYAINYFDVTNMTIDLRIRDITEYVKTRFYQDTINPIIVYDYALKNNLNNKEVNLLYARLLFPTYYFDLFEDIILDKKDEDELLKYIDKHEEYEKFLAQTFILLRKNYALYEIDWIKKRA